VPHDDSGADEQRERDHEQLWAAWFTSSARLLHPAARGAFGLPPPVRIDQVRMRVDTVIVHFGQPSPSDVTLLNRCGVVIVTAGEHAG
jgi:hypothetical protein